MTKLRAWLINANGWKRLWLVMATIGTFYLTLVNPFVFSTQSSLSEYQYRWAVEKELANPECLQYTQKSLSELSEPAYQDSEGTKGCYHIYNYRKYNNPTQHPYTLENLNADFTREVWGELLTLSVAGLISAVVLSAFIYFCGFVVAWVVGGFRRAD